MKRIKKTLSLFLSFVLLIALTGNLVMTSGISSVQAGSEIELVDWKIAPSGSLTVGTTNYPLTAGLPAIAPDATAALASSMADWVDAKCPGTVAGALLDAGKYDQVFMAASGDTDVYFDANMTKIPYTDFAKPWWWRTGLDIPQSENGKKVTLTFKGISTVGRIWVNGQELSNKNYNISDIREVQNKTALNPNTYTTPTSGSISNNWSSVASYTNANITNDSSAYSFDALKSKFIGTYRTYEIDITNFIKPFNAPNGSAGNSIMVEVTRGFYKRYNDGDVPTGGDLLPFWVDWHPTPADHNMGLIGRAFITISGDVRLSNPAVASKVADDYSYADVTFYVNASNLTGAPVSGSLAGVIKGPDGETVGTVTTGNVTIPGSAYNHELAATIRISDPELWWPYMFGDQPLYTVDYTFSVGNNVNDTLKHRFGIREITNEVNLAERNIGGTSERNQMQIYVNHQPILVRGGGYCPTDMYLRQREKDHQGVIDYIKYMGMNAIRDEGKFWSEDLLDLLDENGIMFMSGWCCCDRGQNPNAWLMSERYVAYESLYGQIYTHRSHPCTIMWLNGSDAPPEGSSTTATNNAFNVGRKYMEIESRLDWYDIGVVACSADQGSSGITGSTSGLKMSVGYDSCTPTDYFANTRGSYAFVSEGHGGAGIPVIETMKKMIPEANLWPNNIGANYNRWNYHSTRENFPNIDTIQMYIDNTYGGSDSLEEWLMRAQVYQYDIQRAQYEAFNLHRYADATGHINWMTSGTRPGLMWNQFDYYMNPFGSTFGAHKGNEAVHIFYDYWQKDIYAINSTPNPIAGLTASCTVYDIAGNIIGVLADLPVDLARDGTTGVKTGTATNRTIGYVPADKTSFNTTFANKQIPYGRTIPTTSVTGINKLWTRAQFDACLTRPTSDVYFLKLELKNADGNIVSRNDYAVPRRGDITGAGGSWARTTAHANADMTQLNQLPAVNLQVKEVSRSAGDIISQVFEVTNASKAVAYAIELKSYKDADLTELVNPIIYEDNLFTLYPFETRTIEITHRSKYFDGYANVVATCYNNVIQSKQAPGNLYAAAYSTQVATAGASTNLARGRTAALGTGNFANTNATTLSANSITRSNGTYAYTIVESDYSSTQAVTTANAYITVDLGSDQAFDRIMVRWNSQTSTGGVANTLGGRPDRVTIAISSNNTTYTPIITNYDNTKGASVMTNFLLDKTYTARYIRITPSGLRTVSAAIDMLTNAYPDGPDANYRRPWMSGINQVNAATQWVINSIEVFQSYSHLIQVNFAGAGNTASVTAGALDGYGKAPAAITPGVADKYTRMRMIPNGGKVEFRIASTEPGTKIFAQLDGVNITGGLTANADGSASFFSDTTNDFAELTAYTIPSPGYLFDINVTRGSYNLVYGLSGDALPKVNASIILAFYSVSGKMIDVKTEVVTIADSAVNGTLSVPFDDVPGAVSVKGFLWNANTYVPLIEAVEWK